MAVFVGFLIEDLALDVGASGGLGEPGEGRVISVAEPLGYGDGPEAGRFDFSRWDFVVGVHFLFASILFVVYVIIVII